MDGNIRTKTETLLGSTKTTEYTYDGAGRLWSETAEDGTISYTYDARGNRTHMNNAGTVTAYTYDANNRLLSETVGGETTAYTYDANGNTLTAGNRTYTYNARGQQTGYTDGTVTASYAYNPSGLRSSKTVGGSTKYFIYNGMNIVYEYDDSGETLYYYGLNRTHNSDGEIYVYNAHGDVVQLVKDNAVIVSYTYDAFGNITEQIGTNDNPFLYCGEYYDAETETYYLRARYYNPANGRFTQQDAWGYMNTSDPLSLNLYTYCNNNPIMYVDPSGHAGEATATWLSSMWWLRAADAVLPIGDAVYTGGTIIAAGVDVVNYFGVENVVRFGENVVSFVKDAVQWVSDKVGSNSSNSSSPGDPEDPKNWNSNSTQVNSKTLYNKNGIRVDVENPSPTTRPGQVHIQTNGNKYIYDNVTKMFYDSSTYELAPKSVQKLMNDPEIVKAVTKGVEKYLGLPMQ